VEDLDPCDLNWLKCPKPHHSWSERHTMAADNMQNDNSWRGVDESLEDPEEERVIFSALDSFM